MSTTSLSRRLDRLLATPNLADLVRAYFDPAGPFAGHTFDTLGHNPHDRFTEGDLLAVTLLDVTCSPPVIRELLDRPARWTSLLGAVSNTMPLWEMDADTYKAADTLWQELVRLPGIGPTKAGKLLARKRPALIPIFDEVIRMLVSPSERGLWWDLHEALQDAERRARIDELAAGSSPLPTTVRLVDVAVWMRCGNSTNARNARVAAGLPAEPLRR